MVVAPPRIGGEGLHTGALAGAAGLAHLILS